jgi:hypothetical protein
MSPEGNESRKHGNLKQQDCALEIILDGINYRQEELCCVIYLTYCCQQFNWEYIKTSILMWVPVTTVQHVLGLWMEGMACRYGG